MPSPQTEPNASVPAPETSAGYTLVSAQIQDVHEAIAKLDLGKKCFDRFWQSVIALDETYRRLSGTDFPGDETERAIAAKALGESSTEASITDLLSLAGRQHEALLNARDLNLLPPEEALRATIANLEKLGIFVVRDNDAIFVETAHAAGICRGDGEGVPPPQYQPRVEQLILELQSCGIYKEDLIVRVGSVRANMIRTLPYIIIEIPGINREIAVCNQIGEVTFIARTIFGPNFYTSHTKSELKENPRISSVAYRDRSTWISEIKDLLFVPGDDIRRIDVRDIENLRTAIKAQQGMSVEHWVTMTKVEKLNYRVPQTEMGLKALATRMEVHGNPLGSQKFHLQLAQKIFGESEIINSALLKISQHEQDFQLSGSELIAKVRSDPHMTSQRWIAMTQRERLGYRVPGTDMGLRALATRLGVDRDPSTNHRFHLLLAREIFGESEIVSSALLKNSQRKAASHLTGAQLVEKIISDPKMTVEHWMAMGWREKPKFRVPDTDIGLRVLAAKLKVEGDPVCTRKSHLLLAQKIFGESETLSSALLEISKHEASTLLTSAELIDRIVSDPKMRVATWIGMTQRERRRYHVPGTEMGLEALATQLEVSGNPIASHKFHLQLARKIFGESEVLSSALLKNSRQEASLALSPADLINKVKSDPQMTLQRWIAMTQRERVGYRVPGTTMGLRALAGQLDIKGNPTNNHKFHLQLAQKIFGESEVLSSALLRNSRQEASLALSPADLINKVKSDPQMTLQRWIAMTQRERVEYRVPGTTMGLRVLATRLDVDGDPTCNRKSHLMLAQKIFDAAEWGVFPQRPN